MNKGYEYVYIPTLSLCSVENVNMKTLTSNKNMYRQEVEITDLK